MFDLEFSETALAQFRALERDRANERHFKAVKKALKFLMQNPRHPALNTHEWVSERCPHGDKLWEAYAENCTSGAYRIFFCYTPGKRGAIQIQAITPHP